MLMPLLSPKFLIFFLFCVNLFMYNSIAFLMNFLEEVLNLLHSNSESDRFIILQGILQILFRKHHLHSNQRLLVLKCGSVLQSIVHV